ncbi:MAG: exodeoxyribonuclease VII large subunit, partial [Gammaproteobacteria bacterium]|nr:exodeoxyribonuclease VII large subunit [Gammaproteobacteria bacterium]
FTLKDDKAQIRCAMFRNRNHLVRFKPRNGQQIIVRGRVSLYENRGEFQMIAEFLEDSGDGALRQAFEKLRSSLQAEGLFDESRKQPVPAIPSHIAIITSPHGAAIRDVIAVMKRRFPAIHVSILPVQVQGEESVAQIVQALTFANAFQDDPFDLVLMTRGGGSLEDLWSFNTEPVVRAIAASRLPVVSAVGHESDVTIADFVADLRAPTPSAAAELITPDGEVWEDSINEFGRRLDQAARQLFEDLRREVTHLQRRLRHPASHLEDLAQRLDDLERRLQLSIAVFLNARGSKLAALRLRSPVAQLDVRRGRLQALHDKLISLNASGQQRRSASLGSLAVKLETLSPLATLQRGFAIVSSEPDGNILASSTEVNPGDKVKARLSDGTFTAEIISTEN